MKNIIIFKQLNLVNEEIQSINSVKYIIVYFREFYDSILFVPFFLLEIILKS